MIINFDYLKSRGYECDFNQKAGEIHIYPTDRYHLDIEFMKAQLADLNLDRVQREMIISDYIEKVHSLQLLNVINDTPEG